MTQQLSDIGQIAITVSDVSIALPFYRDVLGLNFLFSPAPTLAFLSAGSIRIMLSTPQGAGVVGANSTLYFKVENIGDRKFKEYNVQKESSLFRYHLKKVSH